MTSQRFASDSVVAAEVLHTKMCIFAECAGREASMCLQAAALNCDEPL